jgi:hypothetical protein
MKDMSIRNCPGKGLFIACDFALAIEIKFSRGARLTTMSSEAPARAKTLASLSLLLYSAYGFHP